MALGPLFHATPGNNLGRPERITLEPQPDIISGTILPVRVYQSTQSRNILHYVSWPVELDRQSAARTVAWVCFKT